MKRLAVVVGVVASLGFANVADACDTDTHFNMTTITCEYAGIAPEVCDQIATYTQWIDVSWMTTPMLVFPVKLAIHLRRLFHFPGDPHEAHSLTHGPQLANFITEAKPNHPVAAELAEQGLREGNLMKLGAAVHILQDSLCHAKYSAELGHGIDGHWPDRPWWNPEAYAQMIRLTFNIMTAIRDGLPDAAKTSFTDGGGTPNVKLNFEELGNKFLARQDVQQWLHRDVLADPEYVKLAVEYVLQEAQQEGFLAPGVEAKSLYPSDNVYDGKREARAILHDIVKDSFDRSLQAGHQVFNVNKAINALSPGLPIDYVTPLQIVDHWRRLGLKDDLVTVLVDVLAKGHIPEAMAGTQNPDGKRIQFEEEGDLRKLEVHLRKVYATDLQNALFGRRSEIDPKLKFEKVKLAVANLQKQKESHEALLKIEAKLKDIPDDTEILTMSDADRWYWRRMIFNYAYTPYLKSLIKIGGYRVTNNNQRWQFDDIREKLFLTGQYGQLMTEDEYRRLKAERLGAESDCKTILSEAGEETQSVR